MVFHQHIALLCEHLFVSSAVKTYSNSRCHFKTGYKHSGCYLAGLAQTLQTLDSNYELIS